MDPVRDLGPSFPPPPPAWQPRKKFQDRVWLHALLFLLTVATTTLVGAQHYANFRAEFLPRALPLSGLTLLLRGLVFSGTVLSILGAHELGHYFACRYYDVDASLPYFLPFPPILFFSLTGTLGAVIRIRERMQSKRVLFDVGVAGPIAGFLVTVPALIIGMGLSNVVRLPDPLPPLLVELGEPPLFRAVGWLFFGTIPDGYTVNMHPVAWAAWFGMLATAMNLLPVGQLDGGHISYAVLGRRSTYVTFAMLGIAVLLIGLSPAWLFWILLMVLMLGVFGLRHPATSDEYVPLDRSRLILAVFAVAMFILCFTPAPIREVASTFVR